MNMTSVAKVTVLRKVEKKGVTDPTKTYYSLLAMQDSEAGALSCSKDVYDQVSENQVVSLFMAFNEKYGSFRATGVVTATVEK